MKNTMSFYRFLFCAGALILSGCASFKTAQRGQDGSVQLPTNEPASEDVNKNLAKPYQSPLGEIPLDDNKYTQMWIKYFQGRGRSYMEKYLERSSRYLPMMKNTLREHGLPENLVYVALIESGFSPLAHSRANAVGYWQFIRSTGKIYGLDVNPFIDERRDPVLATRAAAEHFRDLYNSLGSWHLALAAYNAGERRVRRATVKFRTRDFWHLVSRRRSLAKETKHYVPKFIAATMIARDPEKYGFTNISYQPQLDFETVKLANPISMSKLAQNMNIDVEEIKLLNPKFRGDYVPLYKGNDTVIRVPVGKVELAAASVPGSLVDEPKVLHADYYYYRVRRGDVLSVIARRHRTSVATLRRLNGLGSRSLLRIGQRLKVPDRGGTFVSYSMNSAPAPSQDQALNGTAEATESAESAEATETTVHVVRRGENLTTIAKRYGITIAELRKLNQLRHRSLLRIGQQLKIRDDDSRNGKSPSDQSRRYAGRDSKRVAKGRVASRRLAAKRHRVRRGETLSEIAEKYQVSVRKIIQKNRIKNRAHVVAGRELIIPSRN